MIFEFGKCLTSWNQFHYKVNEQEEIWQTSILTYDKPHMEIWDIFIS